MSDHDDVKKRWKFDLPHVYRTMFKTGLLDMGKDKKCLCLSDTEWLSADDIAELELANDAQRPTLVPFAMNNAADTWCFETLGSGNGDKTPIAFCPHDDNYGKLFAPSLNACVFRLLVEEFAGTQLVDRVVDDAKDLPKLFKRYAKVAEPFFEPAWVEVIEDLLAKPFKETKEEGTYTSITFATAEKVVRETLRWKEWDKKIRTVKIK